VESPPFKEALGGRRQQVEAPNPTRESMVADSCPKLVPEPPASKVRRYRERAKKSDLAERFQADGSESRPPLRHSTK
jgi:hypothetical protein